MGKKSKKNRNNNRGGGVDGNWKNKVTGGGGKNCIMGTKVNKQIEEKTSATADLLKLALEKYGRISPHGLLDLENVSSIKELSSYDPNFHTVGWGRILAVTIKKLDSENPIRSLTLDHNNIKVLYHIADSLADGIELDSLSLRNNCIENLDELTKLRPLKLKHLLLAGNPVLSKHDPAEMFLKIRKALPTLQRIDNCEIDRTTAIDTFTIKYGGVIEGNSLHDDVKQLIGNYFIQSQTASKDKEIDKLLDFYHTKAKMRFSFDKQMSFSVSPQGMSFKGKLDAETKVCRVGKFDVGKCLETLHSVEVEYDGNSIISNTEITPIQSPSVQASNGPVIVVTMHGGMTLNLPSNGGKTFPYKKFFDRTWLLTPGSTGNPVIINDALHIRDCKGSDLPVFKSTINKKYYGLHMKEMDDKTIALSVETGLALRYSKHALEDVHAGPWDLVKAKQLVERKLAHGELPQECFEPKKDRTAHVVAVFQELTNLTEHWAVQCCSGDGINYDLWAAWLLFLAREPQLDESHFMPPSSSN